MPKLESDVVGVESVQQKAGEQAKIGEREQERDIEADDDWVYSLAKNAVEQEEIRVRCDAEVDAAHQLFRFEKNQNPGEAANEKEMIFVHAGVEAEISEVSEHRIDDKTLEGLPLSCENEKNQGVTQIEQDFGGPDNKRLANNEDVDGSVLKSAIFLRLEKMQRPGLNPCQIERITREKLVISHGAAERVKHGRHRENGEDRNYDKERANCERRELAFDSITTG